MKKRQIWLVIGSVAIVALLSFLIMDQVNANKGEQLAEQLAQNLLAEGLPLQSVRVEKQMPLTFEITLSYEANDSPERKAEILRGRHAVQWHCAQLNHEKHQLSSYIILIQDSSGKQISWEQNFLYPVETVDTPNEYSLNLAEAESYLKEAFQPGSAKVERFELIQEQKDNILVNTLYIRLVEPNLQTLNNELPMRQVESLIMAVNDQKLFPVDICWLEIRGPDSKVWVDLLYDHSIPVLSWWMIDGVSNEWFPHPAPLPNQEPTIPTTPDRLYPVDTPVPIVVTPYP